MRSATRLFRRHAAPQITGKLYSLFDNNEPADISCRFLCPAAILHGLDVEVFDDTLDRLAMHGIEVYGRSTWSVYLPTLVGALANVYCSVSRPVGPVFDDALSRPLEAVIDVDRATGRAAWYVESHLHKFCLLAVQSGLPPT